jgi:hypothetical protein
VHSFERPNTPDDVDAALRVVRRIGYGLFVTAIVLDVLAIELGRVRKFASARFLAFAEEVVPNDRPVLDLALALLGASDH